MKSRQTYLYGVAFHITGDERYLAYASAGVTWLREHAYERDTGSAVTYWAAGKPGPTAGPADLAGHGVRTGRAGDGE